MPMKTGRVCVLAALLVVAGAAEAGVRGGDRGGAWRAHHGQHHLHHHRHRFLWGGALGLGLFWPCCAVEPRAWPPAEPIALAPPEPAVPAAPDPVFAGERGQDARRTESDRRACNREAMTQPAAMSDAAVFHASVLACMRGRGYAIH